MEMKKNVLVCEDDPVQLKILSALINQAGYQSVAARSPSEAVVAARRCRVDAVLADVQLQDGNAFDLVGDLRRFGFDVPVFMTSAYATEGMKNRAQSAGVSFFFEKPFDLPVIRKRVAEALQTKKDLEATVLLVEEHAGVRADLEKAAGHAGFQVIAVPDGTRAVEALSSVDTSIDLVLMDLHAPGVAGANLITRALEIDPALHIIMMSGDASREEIRAGYEAGAAGLLRKPISGDRFEAFLEGSLKVAQAARAKAQGIQDREHRLQGETPAARSVRLIKSYIHAPSHSRKGSQIWTAGSAAVALLLGMGGALGLASSYHEEDRLLKIVERAIERPMPWAGTSAFRQDASLRHQETTEQLRLMQEANEITRRYYEGHLEEMRRQALTQAAPETSGRRPSSLSFLKE